MTDLLFLREAERRQSLATVTNRRGHAFLLDRSIFYATSLAYRHPQPADRGEVWLGGDKRVLTGVRWSRGELFHEVRGATPAPGTKANCHLDGERRDDASGAHTAMHLVLSAFTRMRLGTLTREPSVQGGRQFVLVGRFDASGPALKRILDAANASLQPAEVTMEYRPRDSLHGVDLVPYEDGWTAPGEASLRIVRIGDASILPCDGTHVSRTAKIGRVTISSASTGKGGARVQFRAAKPATNPNK